MKNTTIEYIEISTNILKKFESRLHFDIYVQRTETDYTKIFKINDTIDWDRLASYERKGVKSIFVPHDQYGKYLLFVELLVDKLLSSTNVSAFKEGVTIVKEMINGCLVEFLSRDIVNETMALQASKTVSSCIEVMDKDTGALTKIIGQMVTKPYLFKHSVTVSLLSILLARGSGIESNSTLNIIGLGGLLHDIGISRLSFDPEDKQQMTPEEQKEMWRHPEIGKRLLDPVKSMRTEILDIVLQHHEQPNGHGYPNGLRTAEIFLPAKIVSIADTFSAMIIKRSYREEYTTFEAINRMKNDVGKFDKLLLLNFEKIILGSKKEDS